LIGCANGYNLVGSDVSAMISETNEFMEIHDKELVILTKTAVEIQDLAGHRILRQSYLTEFSLSDIAKGAYPFYMLKEIDEQPAVIRKLSQRYTDENGELKLADELIEALLASDRLYLVAAGTSYHAGYASKLLLETLTQKPVEVALASEWGHGMPRLSEKPFFIFLSQSGETADSRQVLLKASELGIPSLTVTNVAGATLSREATFTLLLYAGPEIAVASTKAYTAQIATLALLAKAVGVALGNPCAIDFDVVHELSLVAQAIEAVLSEKALIEKKVADLLKTTRNAFYIGRGQDYYVAMEASLKLKEVSYIQCEGFAAGELKHGTIALIEEATPVIALISNQPQLVTHTRGNVSEVVARGANVMTIVEEGAENETDDMIVKRVHPYLSCLAMVVPTQLIAYYASLQRGLDVDKPRNLAKSVTVE
jgi:glucosamine--fructose-6-phosphate aminotransferase (isomerizing)